MNCLLDGEAYGWTAGIPKMTDQKHGGKGFAPGLRRKRSKFITREDGLSTRCTYDLRIFHFGTSRLILFMVSPLEQQVVV